MAQGATLLHGEFTPTNDISSYTIAVGKPVNFLIVELKEPSTQSGKRFASFISIRTQNDEVAEVLYVGSNSTGSAIASAVNWSKINANTKNVVEKTGSNYTFDLTVIASNAVFPLDTTYEWFAI